MNKPLKGQTILITRPLHQAGALIGKIHQLGGETLLFPTIEILPAKDNAHLLSSLHQLSGYHFIIFTSANAVRYALPLWPKQELEREIISIGPGTAHELKRYAIRNILVPESHNSEGLLALKYLQKIDHQKIAIFGGENPRPLLKEVLTERGALVEQIDCYRRQLPMINSEEKFHELKSGGINLIVSNSLESLINLKLLLGKSAHDWLQQTPLLVINPAMVKEAEKWGVKKIRMAHGASDDAIYSELLYYGNK